MEYFDDFWREIECMIRISVSFSFSSFCILKLFLKLCHILGSFDAKLSVNAFHVVAFFSNYSKIKIETQAILCIYSCKYWIDN